MTLDQIETLLTAARPHIVAQLASIEPYTHDLGPSEPDTDPSIDVRLNVHNGYWTLLSGDSSYDQDHRGYWGCSYVSMGETTQDFEATADMLIEQVLDHAAQDPEIES